MRKNIYFDNAATTFPKPIEVYDSAYKFYHEQGFSAGRGQYRQASEVTSIVTETRTLISELFSCSSKRRVVFAPSATEAMNIILQGIEWKGGENVYITHFEHNAVLRTLNYIKSKYNINIYFLNSIKETDENSVSASYDIEKIKHQFQDKKPNIIIMNHGSNVCGLIAPIKEITDVAGHYGATTILDCAQTAGLLNIDIEFLNVDYAVFAGHKTLYGPFGAAGFILNADNTLKPLLYGGTGIDSANPELPDIIPDKFEVGSTNTHAIAGLNAALKWSKVLGRELVLQKEKDLTIKLLDCLREFSNVKVIKAADINNQIGVVSCVFDGYSSDNIGTILDEHNIAVRTGLHCAPEAHKFLGTFPEGTVRFSLGYFNNEDDINELEKVLEYIYENS